MIEKVLISNLEQAGKTQAKMFIATYAKPIENIQQLVQYIAYLRFKEMLNLGKNYQTYLKTKLEIDSLGWSFLFLPNSQGGVYQL